MIEIKVNTEDALLAELLVSETARDIARKMGLEARQFSDYHLNRHGTRARYYQAIMDAPQSSYVDASIELERQGQFIQGDCQRLLDLATLSLRLAPEWERLIETVMNSCKPQPFIRSGVEL